MRLLPVRLRREQPRGAIVPFEFAPHVLDHEVRFYFIDAWSGPSRRKGRDPISDLPDHRRGKRADEGPRGPHQPITTGRR